MKKHSMIRSGMAALAVLACVSQAQAESTYGYASETSVSAKADVNITLDVPMLVILRVGSDDATVDTVAMKGDFSGGIPGGVATLVEGSYNPSGWDRSAPGAMTVTGTNLSLDASVWTNAAGGGSLTASILNPLSGSTGLVESDIVVSSTGALAHPGPNLGSLGATSFSAGPVANGTWTYGLSPAATSLLSGSESMTVRYEATVL